MLVRMIAATKPASSSPKLYSFSSFQTLSLTPSPLTPRPTLTLFTSLSAGSCPTASECNNRS